MCRVKITYIPFCLCNHYVFPTMMERQRSMQKMIVQEYEKYKSQLDKSGMKYKILSEKKNEDGSIIIEIKKQYNTAPVGGYLD